MAVDPTRQETRPADAKRAKVRIDYVSLENELLKRGPMLLPFVFLCIYPSFELLNPFSSLP